MKNLIIISIWLFANAIHSQTLTIILKSSRVQTAFLDTCKIGFHPLATNGIDTHLGEEDITNTALGTGEIKVLQRGRADFECFQFNRRIDSVRNRFIFDSLFFDQSFDSKINLRQYDKKLTGFELIFQTGRVSTLKFLSPGSYLLSEILDSMSIKVYTCDGIMSSWSCKGWKYKEYSMGLPDSAFVHLLLFPNKDIYTNLEGIKSPNLAEQDKIILFPNPCQDYITVSCNKDGISRYKLYDTQGNLRRTQSIAKDLREFSISDLAALSSGLYVLVLEDQKGNILSRKKMLKE